MTDVHAIAQEADTKWYREYWLKVAAACLVGLGILAGLFLAGLYVVIRAAVLSALTEHAARFLR